jgi:hypothetical protein
MATQLPPGRTAHLSLALDHGQFFVLDRDAIVDDDAYTGAAQRAGLAQFDGGIAVFTESAWSTATHVGIRLSDSRPTVDVSKRHHVVVGGLVCSSGQIRLFSPEGTGSNEQRLSLPIGTYGVIVCGDGFGRTDERGANGDDSYELLLWPARELPAPRCLKQGLPES